MKYRYAICMFSAAFFLQTTLINIVGIFNVTPNLLLCLVAIFSFLYDDNNSGLVLGVVFGLLYDICFSEYVGIAALAFFIVSLSVMLVNIVMNREAVISVIIISTGATVVYNLTYWCIMAMLGSAYSFVYIIKFLPMYILYNLAVMIMLYYLMINNVIKHHYDRYYK